MNTTASFIAAAPVAVFSVLSDLESRNLVLSSVSRVAVISVPPVHEGSVFMEKRRGMARRRLTVGTFRPPYVIAFNRCLFGLPLHLEMTLSQDRGGTVVTATASTKAVAPLSIIARFAANRWLRECERDLADVKRYVEQRANPGWRPGLSDRSFI